MHKVRIQQVIDSIKGEVELTQTLKFDMNFSLVRDSAHTCGTAGCIAGHAHVLELQKRPIDVLGDRMMLWGDVFRGAQDWLGLDPDQRGRLFFGEGTKVYGNLEMITAEDAITALEGLLATGEVNWDHVRV